MKTFRACTGTCDGIPACDTQDSSIITYQGMVDDYLASDGKGTDVWAPDEQKFTGTITLTYDTDTGTINLGVNGDNGDIAYVKDTAGNVLYATTEDDKNKNGINTLRSSSVLTACVEPGKCEEKDVVSDAITAIKRGKPSRKGRGVPRVLRQVLPPGRSVHARRAGAPALRPPTDGPPETPPRHRPLPNAAPLRTLRSLSDCAGPVTTWVEGLEDTTVGDAGGRPIGFGIDKGSSSPRRRKPPEVAASRRSTTTAPTAPARSRPHDDARGRARPSEALSALSNYFPVSPRLRAAAVPRVGVQRDGHHRCAPPRPDAETRARAPPLTRPPPPRRRALLHLRPRHDHVHAGDVPPTKRCSRPSRSASS